MLMDLLFDGQIEAYFEAGALRTGPCVFVHVPKTAGTSLRNELASFLQPDINIMVDYTDTSRSFHDRMDDAVDRFLDIAEGIGVRFASGHILARHVARIGARLPETRFVTFLRDPVQRIVSDYRYQRSPKHPVHAEFIDRMPTLEHYIQVVPEQNKMAQHLVPLSILGHADPAECVDSVMRNYAFVGIQDMYPVSVRTLTTLLGNPLWPKLRQNVNEDGDAATVTPDMANTIRALNPIDTALYDHFAGKLGAVRERLNSHFASN